MFFITTVIAIIQNVSTNFKKVKTAAIMCFKVSFQKGNLKDDTVTHSFMSSSGVCGSATYKKELSKVVSIEHMNNLLTLVGPQARSPEVSPGEGSGERTTGTNHRERSHRDFSGKALCNTALFVFLPD